MRTPSALNPAIALGLSLFGLLLAGSATANFRFSETSDPRDFSGPDHDTVDCLRGACEAMDALGSRDFMVAPGRDIDHPPEPPGSPADVYWTIEKYMGYGYLWNRGVENHEAETLCWAELPWPGAPREL